MRDRGIQLMDSISSSDNFDLKINVIRDANGLIIQGIVVGNTLNQNKALIVIAHPGEFKFNPTIGAAIDELLFDDDYLRFRHRIREHLEKDKMIVKEISLSQNVPLNIDSYYE